MLPNRWSLSWVLRGELDPRALGVSDFSFPIPGLPYYLPRQSASQSDRIQHNEPMRLEQLIFLALGLGLLSAVLVVGAVVSVRLRLIMNKFNLIDNVQYYPFYLLMCDVFILLDNMPLYPFYLVTLLILHISRF